MNNKISIIIPAYNTEDVIFRTISSVENQTYKNYEMVIINDGSTDGTKEFLNNYKKNNPNVLVYHQQNQGVSAARNKGLEICTGDFVCFLDSDDTYEPTFLEKMIKRQQETDANVIYCGHNKIDSNGTLKREKTHFKEHDILASFFSENGYFHFSGIVIKKIFLIENGIKFDVSKKLTEDILFTVQLLITSNVFCVKEYLFNYYYRSNSAINSVWKEENYLHYIISYSDIIRYIKKYYKKEDLEKIIAFMLRHKTPLEMNYLMFLLIKFKYKEIKYYLKEDLSHLDKLEKSERKKFSFIKNGNYFLMFIGTLYYRYFRINLKKAVR